jgi:hypothetical protein
MSEARRVLFVCLHGSAKSVIAAHHLQRLASERGLAVECRSAGMEPDAAVPPHVVDGLREDGIEPVVTPPGPVTRDLLHGADLVVSFGCDLSSVGSPAGTLITWEGVPAVSDGFGPSRDEITRRLQDLLDDLERRPAMQGDDITVES